MNKILLSILLNSLVLYLLQYLLNTETAIWIVTTWGVSTYLVWWAMLWLINLTIKPILKILTLPLFFLFLWLVSFIVNWIILYLFDFLLNQMLKIPWTSYSIAGDGIEWWINFIIAVAIFTILNMFYTLLFKK